MAGGAEVCAGSASERGRLKQMPDRRISEPGGMARTRHMSGYATNQEIAGRFPFFES
jgi:hypothetical protein